MKQKKRMSNQRTKMNAISEGLVISFSFTNYALFQEYANKSPVSALLQAKSNYVSNSTYCINPELGITNTEPNHKTLE